MNSPDLHRFPLLANARIWKTTVCPGEILLMPEGTFHQCRNATDCLSYSRFHLDTLNLPAFIQSFLDGDAPEIDHATILWNAAKELLDRSDELIDRASTARKKKIDYEPITGSELQIIQTLRVLRHSCRELAVRSTTTNTVLKTLISGECESFDWDQVRSGEERSGEALRILRFLVASLLYFLTPPRS